MELSLLCFPCVAELTCFYQTHSRKRFDACSIILVIATINLSVIIPIIGSSKNFHSSRCMVCCKFFYCSLGSIIEKLWKLKNLFSHKHVFIIICESGKY